MFHVFEHTADIGLRIEAPSLASLLEDAAHGLVSLLVANPEAVAPVVMKQVTVEGDAPDLLLFDWLNELLFVFETEHLLLSQFTLEVSEHPAEELVGDATRGANTKYRLIATCRGEPMDREKHEMEHEVKAITYHALRVQACDEGWTGEVIVDI